MEHGSYSYRYPLACINYDQREIDAVVTTLKAGKTTCGEQVRGFEQAFAKYVGTRHAVMVNSGSSADMLVAFGLGEPDERDEILVPAVTWPTQVWSCLTAGYKVRLIDVDPHTLQIDIDSLKRALSDRTRAVFVVHLLGCVGDMDAIRDLLAPLDGVDLIEDCCEALGARWNGQHVGTFGTAAAFSFFFSHTLATMEGGMVVSHEPERKYRLLRSHGWEPQPDCRFWFPGWGFNVRPMEVQGSFGAVQMTKLPGFITSRQHNADLLCQVIADIDWLDTVQVLPQCEPAWHGFPILLNSSAKCTKIELTSYLEQNGIETRPIVAGNLANQPAVSNTTKGRVSYGVLPGADIIDANGFYIGIHSFNNDAAIGHVADTLRRFRC